MTLRPLEPDLVYTSVGKWGLGRYGFFVLFQLQPLSCVKESGFLFAKKRSGESLIVSLVKNIDLEE